MPPSPSVASPYVISASMTPPVAGPSIAPTPEAAPEAGEILVGTDLINSDS